MKRWVKWGLIGAGTALLATLAATVWFAQKVGPIGSGFVARYLCSSTFISHRDPDVVYREDLVPVNPLAQFFDYRIDLCVGQYSRTPGSHYRFIIKTRSGYIKTCANH